MLQVAHVGASALSGSMTVRGDEHTYERAEAFNMPPGYHAWTEGDPFVMADFGGLNGVPPGFPTHVHGRHLGPG